MRGASPRNLWSALSLSTINAMLSKPLTEEEVTFNQVCSRKKICLLRCHRRNSFWGICFSLSLHPRDKRVAKGVALSVVRFTG